MPAPHRVSPVSLLHHDQRGMFENFSFSSQVLKLVQTGFSGDRLSGLLVGIDRQFRDGVTTRDIGMPVSFSWSFLVEVETCHLRTPYYESRKHI